MYDVKHHLDILCNYHDDLVDGKVVSMGSAGGFSGSSFWKVRGRRGRYCLRRWNAAYPTLERLQFIHAVQWHARQEGFEKFPMPVETLEHLTLVADETNFWQLEPWLKGRPGTRCRMTSCRIVSAMMALAEFHQSVRFFPLEISEGSSPTLLAQEKTLLEWSNARIQELRDKIEGSLHGTSASAEGTETESVESTDASQNALFVADLPESEYCWNLAQAARMALVPCLGRTLRPEVQTLVLRTLEAAVRLRRLLMPGLIRCCNYTLAFQPCLGDIHVGHVFFMPHSVSGFIDFETLHADNVATDVARLLGSMAGSDPLAWVLGLSAYQCVRRLREEELETVNLLRKSHLVVTALRWLNCVFSHGLPVHFSSGLVQRLAALCEGLESL